MPFRAPWSGGRAARPSPPVISLGTTFIVNGTITWPAVTGATSYNLYRNGVLVGVTTSPHTIVTADVGPAITVTAVGAGGESMPSNTLQATATSTLGLLSGPTLWLDERGLTVGTGYSAWADQSGAGHNISQGLAASQPATGATINGYAAPAFDGSNDTLVSAAAASTFITTTAWHTWCVLQVNAISTNDATPLNNDSALAASSNGSWGPFYFRDAGSAPKFSAWQYDGAYKTPTLIDIVTGSPILLESSYDGTNIRARYQSTENATAAGSISLSLAGTVTMGRAQAAGTFLDGKVAAAIVCNAHQSADVISTVRAFLAYKYAVTA